MRIGAVFFCMGAVACGFLAFSASAEAGSIISLFHGNDSGTILNTISDDSVENIIQRDVGNSSLDVGDSVRGILNINTVKSQVSTPVSVGAGTSNNELTAIFQTIVLAKIPTVGKPGRYTYIFGPDPFFAEAGALGLKASAIGDAGAMVLFYEDTTPDYNSTGVPSTASDEATAKNGTYWAAFGATGAFWGANGTWDTPNLSGALLDDVFINSAGESWQTADDTWDPPLTSGTIGTADFALNRLYSGVMTGTLDSMNLNTVFNPFSVPFFGPVYTETEIIGDTQFFGNSINGVVQPWAVTNETNFKLAPIVPLPAAAWMGLALLGALGVGRRFRRRS
jgi:hypothetical protein